MLTAHGLQSVAGSVVVAHIAMETEMAYSTTHLPLTPWSPHGQELKVIFPLVHSALQPPYRKYQKKKKGEVFFFLFFF